MRYFSSRYTTSTWISPFLPLFLISTEGAKRRGNKKHFKRIVICKRSQTYASLHIFFLFLIRIRAIFYSCSTLLKEELNGCSHSTLDTWTCRIFIILCTLKFSYNLCNMCILYVLGMHTSSFSSSFSIFLSFYSVQMRSI